MNFWSGRLETELSQTKILILSYLQLPIRVGIHGPQARLNYEHTMSCLIQISRYKFSLILGGLTKALQRTSESVSQQETRSKVIDCQLNSSVCLQWLSGTVRQIDSERCYYDTLIIILTTLERCMANQTKDTARFEEAIHVKLLLRELCQFIDINETNPNALALKALASKVLFALSQNHFSAVFNRISARLQELSTTSEENPDFSDIELIQHIDLDVPRLTKLLTGMVSVLR